MTRHLFTAADNIGVPCGCQECLEAGVADQSQQKVPGEPGQPPIWLHGWRLRRWFDEREAVRAQFGRAL